MSAIYNLVVSKGYSFTRKFRWKDETGNYVNLAGYFFELIVTDPVTKKIIATYNTNETLEITQNPGEFVLKLSTAYTTFLNVGEYDYVIKFTIGDFTDKFLEGKFRVN